VRPRERQALRNRASDGCTLEELSSAVDGAKDDAWLRRRSAMGSRQDGGCVAFAVVFATLLSVRNFAAIGRRLQASTPPARPPRPTERGPAERRPGPAEAPREQATPPPPGVLAALGKLWQQPRPRRPTTREEREDWHGEQERARTEEFERRRADALARAREFLASEQEQRR
jgi:hypothetical protein